MDQGSAKRNKTKKKKVLLSIVDPWDVKVASVDPVGLAGRRGILIESLEIGDEPNGHCANVSPPSAASTTLPSSCSSPPKRTPWPWYKPDKSTSPPGALSTQPINGDGGQCREAATVPADVSIKEQGRSNDVRERSSPPVPDAAEEPLLGEQQRQERLPDAQIEKNERTNLNSLVEELVRSRYNRRAAIYRKLQSNCQLPERDDSSGSISNVS